MDSLVSTDWLAQHLDDVDLVVVDASWHMPATGRKGEEEYRRAHIRGARFLDIDAVSGRENPAPHMLPSPAEFARAMEALGVGSDDRIVVYDNSPLRTAARGWFMLRHFGAAEVAILDGGLQKWVAEGRPTETGDPAPPPASFAVRERADVVDKAAILAGTGNMLVDARGAGRFTGDEPEPRPGLASGHIPGSRNIPYAAIYRENGSFRSPDEIATSCDSVSMRAS